MARPLRFIPVDSVVEVTCRTIQGRYLLKPSPGFNDLVVGILGRALELCPTVRLHAFVFASNHFHMLLSVPNAQALASFMNHFNSKVAREAGRMNDWSDKLWSRRYQAIVVADEPAQVDRLRYILSHGTKEKFVASPAEWPGVSCVDALTEGEELFGTWIDRTAETRARHRSANFDASRYRRTYHIHLSPLPCWREATAEQRQELHRELVARISDEWAAARTGAPVLGAAAVLQQHPHTRPASIKRTAAPLVHARTASARQAFLDQRREYVNAFRLASERLRQGQPAEFPPLSFPPRAQFLTTPVPPVNF
jgi:hypothetical protein